MNKIFSLVYILFTNIFYDRRKINTTIKKEVSSIRYLYYITRTSFDEINKQYIRDHYQEIGAKLPKKEVTIHNKAAAIILAHV